MGAASTPRAALAAALLALMCVCAAGQNCSRVIGCSACVEVPDDSGSRGRGRGLLARGLLRRGGDGSGGGGGGGGDDPPGQEHPPGHDDAPCNGTGAAGNKTRVNCTECDAARGFVLDTAFPICVCPPGQELPKPPAGQPIAPDAACQPCADGFVSGPGAALARNRTRRGTTTRSVTAFARARGARHGGAPGPGKFRGWFFCVPCPAGYTSNADHTACEASA